MAPRIALIGDYNPRVIAHQGIDRSLALARRQYPELTGQWVPTPALADPDSLAGFSGYWVVPASPYLNTPGVIAAITHARTTGIPYLGTCGGFQYAVIEFARVGLGIDDAEHSETATAGALVVTPLSCALVEKKGRIQLVAGSRLRDLYGVASAEEGYHCTYGIDPAFAPRLEGAFRVGARDDAGEVRAIEHTEHPFFIATLYQPERRGLGGALHPLIHAFVKAVL